MMDKEIVEAEVAGRGGSGVRLLVGSSFSACEFVSSVVSEKLVANLVSHVPCLCLPMFCKISQHSVQ